ncbi:hypothetical protein KQX54_010370, partial [Cotesia glomerata]
MRSWPYLYPLPQNAIQSSNESPRRSRESPQNPIVAYGTSTARTTKTLACLPFVSYLMLRRRILFFTRITTSWPRSSDSIPCRRAI